MEVLQRAEQFVNQSCTSICSIVIALMQEDEGGSYRGTNRKAKSLMVDKFHFHNIYGHFAYP